MVVSEVSGYLAVISVTANLSSKIMRILMIVWNTILIIEIRDCFEFGIEIGKS